MVHRIPLTVYSSARGAGLQVVVYSTLLPLRTVATLIPAIVKYLDGIAGHAVIKKAESEVIGGNLEAVSEIFRFDGKAFAAAQPKLPIPGQRNILVGKEGRAQDPECLSNCFVIIAYYSNY